MRPVLSALLEMSVYSVLLFGALMGFRALTRGKASPALRHGLWFLLVARLLLPVTWASPVQLIRLPQPPAQVQAIATPVPRAALTFDQPAGGPVAAQAALAADIKSPALPVVAAKLPLVTPKPGFRLDWVTALGALWLAGVVIMTANLLRLTLRRNRRLAGYGIIAPEHLRRQMVGLARDLGVARPPRLWLLPDLASPCLTTGPWPALLLPADMAAHFPPQQIALALAHELTHLRRGDHLVEFLWSLLRCVHWFNPVVWLAARFVREDMELTCDAALASRLNAEERGQYARMLLALFSRGGRPALALGMAPGRVRQVAERRIRGVFAPPASRLGMKALSVLLALALLVGCFTTACQPTPAKPAVVQKNIDKMEKQAVGSTSMKSTPATVATTATSSEGDKELNAKLQAPDRFTATVDDPSGKLTITADASIVLPAADKLPTARVQASSFSQQTVDKLIEVLMQDQPLYDSTINQQTKKDIWPWLQQLYEMRDGKRKVDVDGSLEENIKAAEKNYKEAPDDVKTAPANTELHKFGGQDYESMEAYARIGNIPAYLTVFNQAEMSRVEAQFINRSSAWGAHGFKPWHTITDEELQQVDSTYRRLAIKPEDAWSIADDIVSKLALADTLNAVTLSWAINDTDHILAYDVQYRRAIKGVPVTITGQRGELYRESSDSSYAHAWPYEVFDIYVTDQGLTELQWTSPYTTPQLVTADTQLLPFPDIAQRFHDAILAKYAIYEKGTTGKIHIDSVQLGLMRIKDPRTNDEGLLVPVWDFFGVASYHPSDRGDYASPRDSLLTINAIDGSVIDRDLGY